MIIYNENGEYTDIFNEYLSEQLEPQLDIIFEDILKWLSENNAKPVDYRVIEEVFCDILHLDFLSAWLDQIEIMEIEKENDTK